MHTFIASLWDQIELALPLFTLILLGYGLVRFGKWPKVVADCLTRFVFSIAIPIMLFRLMSNFSQQPVIDSRLLIAFFGACFICFIIGRLVGSRIFHLDGISGSVFALGGIFSNNVMLGLPLATILLGKEAIPIVALVLIFNALILWTLVTISVEWAKNGKVSFEGFFRTAINVLKTPIIIGILFGVAVSQLGFSLPMVIEQPTLMIGQMAAPLSLIALGMGLAEYPIRDGWQLSVTICAIKLLIMPFFVWILARSLNLPLLETKTVVLLGSMGVGANVYLMSRQFNVLVGPTASSLVLSTLVAGLTTPLIMVLTNSSI